MKNIGIISAILLALFAFSACNKNKVTKVPLPEGYYENDWDGALKAAGDHDRNMFVHFYADWCSLCASFKEDVLNNSEVETYMNAKFIGVLMDSEKGTGKERFEHYGLSGHPNFAIIDKDNKLIGQHNGKMSKQEFLDWIKPFE